MNGHDVIFGDTCKTPEAPVRQGASGNEGWSRKINTIEVIDNRIYFYAEIYREDILSFNRRIRDLRSELIRDKLVREIADVKLFIHIQSYGGNVFSGLSAMDEILAVKKDIPIITVIDGCCASAATFLSVVGSKRRINKHAFMLIHQLSSVFWGKYQEFEDNKTNLDVLMETIRSVYREYTKLPGEELEKILKHDLWLSAEKCLEFGLVDEIV